MKKLLIILSFIAIVFPKAANASADFSVSESSAVLVSKSDIQSDYRVDLLEDYLKSHNSPLAPYAYVFIEEADKYNLDWRLVPAITGVESTFGKRIPANSYNAYGWANGKYRFGSWEESIHIVSMTLREKYLDSGATNLRLIARRYAASPTWEFKVRFFMQKIEPLPVEFTL